jgi:hypothetical protein
VQTRLRSPYTLSIRPTVGQNLVEELTQGAGNAVCEGRRRERGVVVRDGRGKMSCEEEKRRDGRRKREIGRVVLAGKEGKGKRDSGGYRLFSNTMSSMLGISLYS